MESLVQGGITPVNIKNNECSKSLLNNLFFCLQPIIRNGDDSNINEYELLLRRKKDQKFPEVEFEYLSQNNNRNELLMAWSYREIQKFLELNTQCLLWININPQQLSFNSTYLFLKSLKKFRKNIKIEITEQIPDKGVDKSTSLSCIRKIREMEYEVAIDDIGMGLNTLSFVLENITQISRLKLSLVSLRLLNQEELILLIKFWKLVANEAKLELVVEGIDSEELRVLVSNIGITMQQGFLWENEFKYLY